MNISFDTSNVTPFIYFFLGGVCLGGERKSSSGQQGETSSKIINSAAPPWLFTWFCLLGGIGVYPGPELFLRQLGRLPLIPWLKEKKCVFLCFGSPRGGLLGMKMFGCRLEVIGVCLKVWTACVIALLIHSFIQRRLRSAGNKLECMHCGSRKKPIKLSA
ncbi:unnamed protein product [Discosporangium mesarthrocarpum]